MSSPLTHFDADGQAHMVDVSAKAETHRVARATGLIRMQPETFALVASGQAKKGDVIGIAPTGTGTTAAFARPILELKGFERVTLAPGERRTVQFTLGPDAFRFFDITMREVVEPGLFDISVGADSTRLN